MKRLVVFAAAMVWASVASAQVVLTGDVRNAAGQGLAITPEGLFVQSCNAGAGGIVGQGSCSFPTGGGAGPGYNVVSLCHQQTYTPAATEPADMDTGDGVCVTDQAVVDILATQGTTLTQMNNSLTVLSNAAGSVTPSGSVNGACQVVLNHPGKFYGGSGTVNGAATVFLLNLAACPADPYTVLAGDLLVAPIVVGAAGTWGVAPMTPLTASVGVVAETSSTLYSAGVLTATKVTATAATNNSIVVIAQ